MVSFLNIIYCYNLVDTVDNPHSLIRGKPEKLPDCSVSLPMGPCLHKLTQKNQCENNCCCFKINIDCAVMATELLRKNTRKEKSNNAEEPCNGRSHTNKGEHIKI